MTPREQVVEIRDGAIRFRCLSAGQGDPVVFFHSFEGLPSWPDCLAQLAGRFAIHAPLHPGVQGSDGVEALDDVVELALAYDELLEALDISSAHLVGHFFGGMVAAELAALCPSRVKKLALLSPMGLWIDSAPVPDVVTLPSAELHLLLWKDPESAVAKAWVASPASEQEQAAAQIERIQRLAAMGKFVWPLPDKGLKKHLHRIRGPTLVVWGDADRVNPLDYGAEFQRRIKSAQLRVLSGGHMLHYEAPSAVARTVTEFLE